MSREPKTKQAIPAKVRVFMDANERIQEFKAKNYAIFKEYEALVEDYNQKLEDAEQEVRAKGISAGPFNVIGTQTNVDVDRLYDELGREEFLRVGGSLVTRVVPSVDKVRLRTYIESGAIPQEVVKACWEEKPRVKAPKKAEVP